MRLSKKVYQTSPSYWAIILLKRFWCHLPLVVSNVADTISKIFFSLFFFSEKTCWLTDSDGICLLLSAMSLRHNFKDFLFSFLFNPYSCWLTTDSDGHVALVSNVAATVSRSALFSHFPQRNSQLTKITLGFRKLKVVRVHKIISICHIVKGRGLELKNWADSLLNWNH